jgi:hypothetical protein
MNYELFFTRDMKQFFLLIIFCVCSSHAQAQLAIIQDPDEYVNMRSKPDNSGDVVRKLTLADIFYCFEPEGEWYPIDVYVKDKSEYASGYIHKSRVKFIDTYDSVSVSQVSKDKIVFKNKTIQVEVKIKPFDPKANIIEYDAEHKYVETINHKRAWGIDGYLPKVTYDYIWVTIGGNKIVLPAESYNNLFQPNFHFMNVNYDIDNDMLYIQGLNSDGAGAYIFAVIIKHKKFERTITMIPF